MSVSRSSQRPPNVLWLMTDEQRTDSLGCYASPWASSSPWARTPNLDRLAREGARFRHAITPAPVCVPARTSIMTARPPHETGVWYNVPPVGILDLLTTRFADAGYRTASFGKRHYASTNGGFQTEKVFEVNDIVNYYAYADQYDESAHDVVKYPPKPYPWIFGGRYPATPETTVEARATQLALDWLDTVQSDEPFLLRVSFNGPHTPVVPPAPFDTLIDEDAIALPPETESTPRRLPRWLRDGLFPKADASRLTRAQIRKIRRYYYGEVAFLDQLFGRIIDLLERRGVLDDTIVILTSDHGTHLGDYGMVQKQTFFPPSVEVPFLIRYPRTIPSGCVFENPVETLSLLPTALDLAGLEVPDHATHLSLAPALRSGMEPVRRPVFSEFTLGSFEVNPDDRIVMVRARDERRDGGNGDEWQLSVCLNGAFHQGDALDGELHNLTADPYQLDNRYGMPEHAAVESWLRGLIDARLTRV